MTIPQGLIRRGTNYHHGMGDGHVEKATTNGGNIDHVTIGTGAALLRKGRLNVHKTLSNTGKLAAVDSSINHHPDLSDDSRYQQHEEHKKQQNRHEQFYSPSAWQSRHKGAGITDEDNFPLFIAFVMMVIFLGLVFRLVSHGGGRANATLKRHHHHPNNASNASHNNNGGAAGGGGKQIRRPSMTTRKKEDTWNEDDKESPLLPQQQQGALLTSVTAVNINAGVNLGISIVDSANTNSHSNNHNNAGTASSTTSSSNPPIVVTAPPPPQELYYPYQPAQQPGTLLKRKKDANGCPKSSTNNNPTIATASSAQQQPSLPVVVGGPTQHRRTDSSDVVIITSGSNDPIIHQQHIHYGTTAAPISAKNNNTAVRSNVNATTTTSPNPHSNRRHNRLGSTASTSSMYVPPVHSPLRPATMIGTTDGIHRVRPGDQQQRYCAGGASRLHSTASSFESLTENLGLMPSSSCNKRQQQNSSTRNINGNDNFESATTNSLTVNKLYLSPQQQPRREVPGTGLLDEKKLLQGLSECNSTEQTPKQRIRPSFHNQRNNRSTSSILVENTPRITNGRQLNEHCYSSSDNTPYDSSVDGNEYQTDDDDDDSNNSSGDDLLSLKFASPPHMNRQQEQHNIRQSPHMPFVPSLDARRNTNDKPNVRSQQQQKKQPPQPPKFVHVDELPMMMECGNITAGDTVNQWVQQIDEESRQLRNNVVNLPSSTVAAATTAPCQQQNVNTSKILATKETCVTKKNSHDDSDNNGDVMHRVLEASRHSKTGKIGVIETIPSDDPHKAMQANRKRLNIADETNAALSLQGDIDFAEVTLLEVIGGGGFGQVWGGTWRCTPVAVKVLTGSAQSKNVPRAVLEGFAAEINLLKGMRHPNICLYMGACLLPPNRAIITELAIHGSLWDALRLPLAAPYVPCDGTSRYTGWPEILYKPDVKHGIPPTATSSSSSSRQLQLNTSSQQSLHIPSRGTWHWVLVKHVALGAARGMAYLHSGKPPILHRDLKSANILLFENYTAKVCDFGLSRLKAQERSMTGNCGTVQWMAPEVLGNEFYNEKADVFSFGVILWELLSRECPFDSMTPIQCALAVLNRNQRPDIPKWCPPGLHALIRSCWKKDPTQRPSFPEILAILDSLP